MGARRQTFHGDRIAIVGAGIGGLAAAVDLACRGFAVTVYERAATPGGKMRVQEIDGARIDAGPTVLTMRRVFEELFANAGSSLERHIELQPLDILARHAWSEHERLDLFADASRTREAIHAFAGADEAQRYLDFARHCARIHRTLDVPFMRSSKPTLPKLVGRVGLAHLHDLLSIQPFDTLWSALGRYFHDPRLRQLFGRYATYCGSSPFAAPATMMLIAHVEQAGVWTVTGGMERLALAMAGLAKVRGASFRFGSEVKQITTASGRASGVTLASGEHCPADVVLVNADTSALAQGLFGSGVTGLVPTPSEARRSLSAITWTLLARTEGFPLLRHTVFFSRDYPAEFAALFGRRETPQEPTVYVCAQDRGGRDAPAPAGPERLLCLINAPATSDSLEIEQCEQRTFSLLERCGLRVDRTHRQAHVTTPQDFGRMFPATGGALYGQATHGWQASFRRPGSRTRLPGLYLAGGSVHPGPGVPMAALSGRLAAATICADLDSISRLRHVAMPGGISTR
jgi:1-hydroxycarotenoid 3,4-desaturase